MKPIDIYDIKKYARKPPKVKLKQVAAKLGILQAQLSTTISDRQNTGYQTINKILRAIKDIKEGK